MHQYTCNGCARKSRELGGGQKKYQKEKNAEEIVIGTFQIWPVNFTHLRSSRTLSRINLRNSYPDKTSSKRWKPKIKRKPRKQEVKMTPYIIREPSEIRTDLSLDIMEAWGNGTILKISIETNNLHYTFFLGFKSWG